MAFANTSWFPAHTTTGLLAGDLGWSHSPHKGIGTWLTPRPPLFQLVPYRSYVITIPDERCDAAPNRMSVVGLFDALLTDSVLIQIASMLPHKPLHSHSQPVARVKDRQVPQAISLGTKSSQTDSTSYSPVCNLGAKFWWCLFPTCTKRPAPQMR